MSYIRFFCFVIIVLMANISLHAQVTMTHTTNADFSKGIAENILVKNDGLALSAIKGSINEWTSTTNLPQNLSGHQMTGWRTFVFLSGGFNGTKYTNSVYKATINATGIGPWTQLVSLPDSVGFHSMVATATKLYVFGGKKGSSPSNKVFVATINDDGTLGPWQQSSVSLPQPLWGHTAHFINGFIYVVGGTNQTGISTALNSVYYSKIDPDDNISTFVATTDLPEARNGHSMAKYNGKLYVTGGFDNSGVKKSSVYYTTINPDGSCGTWLSATPLPIAVSNHASTCSNGIITVIGGEESSLPGNKFYFADVDNAPSLIWELSDRYLYDRTKNASAFIGDNQVLYAGGTNLSGSPINSIRYVLLNPSADKVKKGIYISSPFVVGAPKNIQKLAYTISTQAGDSYELLYRLAGGDKVWGDWISAGTNNPAMINQSMSYIQYMFRFLANSTSDIVLSDITMTVSGYTQLCGSLDAMSTITTAGSPYWATCNVIFSTGAHIIQPGVTICFSPNTSLEIGQASVNFSGTSGQPITLTYYDTQDGLWNGIYFKDASDAGGVTSQLTYTTIEKAGNGTNNANLWCNLTNQPVINNCTINNAVGQGIRLENANLQISNTIISNNVENGLYLSQSSPVLNNVTTKFSGYAGIYYATAGLTPTYINTKSENNLYGMYSPTPDNSFAPVSLTSLQLLNNTSDVAMSGGVITANRTWKYFSKGYVIMGDVTVNLAGGNPMLTIAPGNEIKVLPNFGLYIGGAATTGGQLYAVGKADSIITFTAYNNTAGGWKGLYFNDGSDYNSTSSLRYCVIEKGNEYNIFSVNTNEPHIMFSTIRNSATNGIKLQNANLNIEETLIKKAQTGLYLDNSSPSLVLLTIDSIQTYCVYKANVTAVPNFFQCAMKNSKFGIYYPDPNITIPLIPNITFTNLTASVALNGGTISTNQTWYYNPYGYAILGNLIVGQENAKIRLTIKPGCILKVEKNMQIQIANFYQTGGWPNPTVNHSFGGELFAEGKQDSIITFTALNDSVGGWNGIYFHDLSDWQPGSISLLKYCTIQKGNQYNIWCSSTAQPTIDSCSIKNSLNIGLHLESSPISISNSDINNNGEIGINSINSLLYLSNLNVLNNSGYGLYYNNALYVHNLNNLQIAGNSPNAVVINGGTVSENRTWPFITNCPYIILNNLLVAKENAKIRLTIKPGCTLKVAKNMQIQIANFYQTGGWPNPTVDHSFGGELFAEGKQDSIITFTALNDSLGGWNGIYFHNYSDEFSSISNLKYCTIENGNQYNIWCNNTTQPTFENATITQSAGYGLWLDAGSNVVKNSSIKNNNGHGVYMTGGSNPVIGNSLTTSCDIYNNGGYNVYNNTASNIIMKYNYLGGCDSTYIQTRIWDKASNSALGRIAFMPTSCLPANFNSSLAVNGRLYYNNSSLKPMRNAVITIKDYNDNTLASAQTSSQGNFSTGSFNVSVPNKIVIIPAEILGGVNSTDALKIMRHFTQLELLASPYSFIADLNKSQTINGTDALMVLRRFAQIINSFPTGDLHLYSDSAFTDNSDFTYKLSALWFGDVNGSYTTLSKNSGVSLMYEGLLAPGSWTEFMMQIKIKNKTVIGAISLALNYPQECLEVLGVQLAKTGEDLLFTEQDGQMKMGWYSLAPVATDEEDVLLSIRFKAKDLRDQTKSICLTLSEGCEISDQNANELRGVILSAPVIQVPANGTGTGSDGDNGTTFSVYPNPVKENVQFSFDLPEPGYVILTVSDMPGRIVARVVNSDQDAGKQNIAFDVSDLPGGVYFCHFKFTSNDRVTNITRKMIVE